MLPSRRPPPCLFNSPFSSTYVRFKIISTSLLSDAPFSCSIAVGRHWEHVTTSWPLRWSQAIRGSPSPPLSLKCMFCSHSGSCLQRHSLIEQCVVGITWTISIWLNPINALYKLKILAGMCRDLCILWAPKTSLMCKFPGLLSLAPANLEWPVCLFL